MNRLDRFLFSAVAPQPAAVFRILFAAVLAVVFWPEGRPVLAVVARLHPDAGPLWESVFLTPLWWSAALVALAAFAAGIGGRKTALWVVASLLPLVLVRGAVSRQMLLLSLVAFSLLRSDPRVAWNRSGAAAPVGPIWPIRLIQLQLSAVYAVNAWAKLTPEYLSGDVLVGLSRGIPGFLLDLSDGSLHLGPLALPVWLCAVGTVAVEAALAVGFWIPRTRIATAALGVSFHLALQWVLTIGWLDWACMFHYLAFLLPFEGDATRRPGASR